jgi:DNA polymerase-3 subunit delta'
MLELYPWQLTQWTQLLAAIDKGKLPHALLLSGTEGIGLEHFAACLAARLLCGAPGKTTVACGECRSCILLKAGNHPDLNRVIPEEEGQQIKVAAIRNLKDYIHLSSQYGRYKVAMISPANSMNRSAANSLLKTLEEPPGEALLILVSHQPALLPVTIRSRCQSIIFPAVFDQVAQEWLQSRLGDCQEIAEILALAHGGPLKAVQLFEAGSMEHQITLLADLTESRSKGTDPVSLALKWQKIGILEVFSCLLTVFSRMSRLKLENLDDNSDKSSIIRYLQALVKGLDLVQIIACYDLVKENYFTATGPININKQGLLEDFIVYWQSLIQIREDKIQ